MKKTIIGLVIKILIGSVLPAVPVAAAIATVSSVIFTEEAVAADTTCSYFLGSLRCTGGLSTVTCSDFLGSFRCTGAYSFTCSEFLGSYRCSGGLAASFTCSEFLGSYRCSGGLADFSCSEFLGSIRCSGIDGSFSCSEFLGSFRCSGTTSPLIPVIAKKFGNLTSSGGTSGGTSSGSTTKSCTKAPEIPSLTSSTTSDGIQFSALAKLTGEKATSLFIVIHILMELRMLGMPGVLGIQLLHLLA